MPRVGVIVLAAGGSTRLGHPKQLVSYQGQSLLRRAAETAVGSVCRPVLVVLGAQAARMRAELDGLPIEVVENEAWEQGLGTSVRAGISALDPEIDAVVLMLCDQPRLSPQVLDALAEAYLRTSLPTAAAEYGGSLGVPALFARALFPELMALGGSEGAKKVIQRHSTEAARVPFPDGLVDIDTPDDVARLDP